MRYYLTLRPPPGTPRGSCLSKAWDKPGRINGTCIIAYGWVEYREPLSFRAVWRYGLWPADKAELARYADWCGENRQEVA